jgi:hypothetical protein
VIFSLCPATAEARVEMAAELSRVRNEYSPANVAHRLASRHSVALLVASLRALRS